jgi:ankyrin repeat protein
MDGDADGKTPVHFAAAKGNTDTVRLLLESWPAGMREKNYSGKTPLRLAALGGKADVVRLLMVRRYLTRLWRHRCR